MTQTRTIAVSPYLAPYVRGITVDDDDGVLCAPQSSYPVYPGPFPVLGLQYRGRLGVLVGTEERALDMAGVTGLQATVRRFVPHDTPRTILLTFEPYGIHTLFGIDMHELTDAHVGLHAVLHGAIVRTLHERLLDAPSIDAAARVVEAHFVEVGQGLQRSASPLVSEAIRRMLANDGRDRIGALTTELGVSARQLERLFRLQVGMGPKRFAALVQFDHARRQLLARVPTVAVAADAGYADQAHFAREFQARTGQTPRRFLTARDSVPPPPHMSDFFKNLS